MSQSFSSATTLKKGPLIMAALLAPVGLFLLSHLLPPLAFLAPAPLYLAYAALGYAQATLLAGVAAAVIYLIAGSGSTVAFLLFCVMIAFAMADAFHRNIQVPRAIFHATTLATVAALFAYIVYAASLGKGVTELALAKSATLFDLILEAHRQGEGNADIINRLEANKEALISTIATLTPFFVFATLFLFVAITYGACRVIGGAWPVAAPFMLEGLNYAQWRLPSFVIWIFAGSGLLAFFLSEGVALAIGLNITVGAAFLYFSQGLSILSHFFDRWRLPFFMQALGFFIVITTPLVWSLLFLGLTDVWVDLRKPDAPPAA